MPVHKSEMARAGRLLVIGTVLTTLAACASYTQPERVGTSLAEYNIAAAKAQNEVLFINIVRSMLREPRHFTAVTQLRRAAQDGSIELGIPFGGGSDDKYSLTPKISGSLGPSADVAVLDSDEFVRGILSPIKPETIDYFLKQGWPATFLWTLLIREVTFKVGATGATAQVTFTNRPEQDGSGTGLRKFAEVVTALTACDLRVEQHEGKAIGPLLGEQDLKDIQKIAVLTQANLALVPVPPTAAAPPRWQIRQSEGGYYFALGDAPSAAPAAEGEEQGKVRVGTIKPKCKEAMEKLDPQIESALKAASPNLAGEIAIRSTEGVIYYLGEIMRAQVEDYRKLGKVGEERWQVADGEGFIRFSLRENRAAVLFRARPGLWSEINSLVRVRYRGNVYLVPPPEVPEQTIPPVTPSGGGPKLPESIDYTPGTLNFVNLMLGLQKSSKDLPRTGAVEVVGAGR